MAILPPDPLFCLHSDMQHIHHLCFVPNETCPTELLAATESGVVYFWNLNTNRALAKHKLGASIQAVHHTGERLITQEKSGLVKLWALDSSCELDKTYECHGGFCKSILVGDAIVVPQNSCLDIVDLKTLDLLRTFKPAHANLGHVMALEQVQLSSAMYVLAGYETGDIVLWDFATAKSCGHLKLRECITSLTFDPLTGRGVVGNSSSVLQVFTIAKDFAMKLKCEVSITNEGCNVVKVRPDRKIFVCGGWDGRLRLFSWKTLRTLAVLNEHKKAVTDVQFSPGPVPYWGSNVIAASGADGVISLWNLYN